MKIVSVGQVKAYILFLVFPVYQWINKTIVQYVPYVGIRLHKHYATQAYTEFELLGV